MNGHYPQDTPKPNLGENFFEGQNRGVAMEWDMKWAIDLRHLMTTFCSCSKQICLELLYVYFY